MSILPPSPFTDSGEPVAPSPGEAAAPLRHVAGVAAEIPDGSALLDCRAASQCLNGNLEPDPSETEPTTDGGGPQESPAVEDRNPDAAGDLEDDISNIGEIFAGARKLDALEDDYLFELDPGNQKYRGMPKPRLHVARFMQELDEPPLFLRQAVRA